MNNAGESEDSIVECIMCKLKIFSNLLNKHFRFAHLIQVMQFNFIAHVYIYKHQFISTCIKKKIIYNNIYCVCDKIKYK